VNEKWRTLPRALADTAVVVEAVVTGRRPVGVETKRLRPTPLLGRFFISKNETVCLFITSRPENKTMCLKKCKWEGRNVDVALVLLVVGDEQGVRLEKQ